MKCQNAVILIEAAENRRCAVFEPQSRVGDKLTKKIQVVCPQNGTINSAVLRQRVLMLIVRMDDGSDTKLNL